MTTLFSAGRAVAHVCPVCLKQWKSSLFSASCRLRGGAQQCSSAWLYENISFGPTDVFCHDSFYH